MRPRIQTMWRHRPRVLTLTVLAVVAVPTAMANFTSNLVGQRYYVTAQYGWPLMWHWHNLFVSPGPTAILDLDYSAKRLAANVLIWLVILAAPVTLCEWLLRRYQRGVRWSLRTMLGAVAAIAAFFGWFAAARNRAELQDRLVAELPPYQTVYVERPGPKWLEFIVPDRYRRRIIGVEMQMHDGATLDEAFLAQLAKLPRLQHLQINVKHRTHGMAVALAKMRRLRSLRIDEYGSPNEDERVSQGFLAVIGTLADLERLSLEQVTVTRASLSCLSGLTKLKSLWLGATDDEGLWANLPALPQLQAIDFGHSILSDRALRHLAMFPRLKAVNLTDSELAPGADLLRLASLESLEELAINASMLAAVDARSFGSVKRLKRLHVAEDFWSNEPGLTTLLLDRGEVSVLKSEAERASQALQAVRRANPTITIDSDRYFMLSNLALVPRGLEEAELASTWMPAYVGWFPTTVADQLRPKTAKAADSSAP